MECIWLRKVLSSARHGTFHCSIVGVFDVLFSLCLASCYRHTPIFQWNRQHGIALSLVSKAFSCSRSLYFFHSLALIEFFLFEVFFLCLLSCCLALFILSFFCFHVIPVPYLLPLLTACNVIYSVCLLILQFFISNASAIVCFALAPSSVCIVWLLYGIFCLMFHCVICFHRWDLIHCFAYHFLSHTYHGLHLLYCCRELLSLIIRFHSPRMTMPWLSLLFRSFRHYVLCSRRQVPALALCVESLCTRVFPFGTASARLSMYMRILVFNTSCVSSFHRNSRIIY